MVGLERILFRVEVAETRRNREYWATCSWVAPVRREEIRAADIIVVPWEDFRDGQKAVFPQGTTSLFRKFKEIFPDRRIAIAIEQGHYKEIALHAREWRLPALFISIALLPALSDVLATQANRWILSDPKEEKVLIEVIVEGSKGRCISISYEGPPDRLVQTLIELASRCFPEVPQDPESESEK
jgi:hypothetical protein